MVIDYLIVGQGICGSFLSWNLLKEGKTVMVIDEARPNSSSKVSGSVINPVTGRRIVKTWMIDELLPFAKNQYQLLGHELGIDILNECRVLQFHATPQMREAFEERYKVDQQYLQCPDATEWQPYFYFNYGMGAITSCLQIDLNNLLQHWRGFLQQKNLLLPEKFHHASLSVEPNAVRYRDIIAKKVIFCNGIDAFKLPYFGLLPYATNKGEALIAAIPGLPSKDIYKQAVSIVPWKDGLFWIGSTYEWSYTNAEPTERFRKKTEAQLNLWLKLPYTIEDHIAAERPATLERRPFVGLHPLHPAIGIFNGMGTKGCSLAPYFARMFTQHLVYGKAIMPEADIKRFSRILSQEQ